MSERDVTTVEVKRTTWQALNIRREPGDTMDDVIQRALDKDSQEASQNDDQHDRGRPDSAENVVEWVRENEPASRQDIVAAFQADWEAQGIQGDSWWRRHAKPELVEAGGEFTRNVGWSIEK